MDARRNRRRASAVTAARRRQRSGADLAGLTSLHFLGRVAWRRAWVWCAAALGGLALSAVLYQAAPPASHASASIMMVNAPLEDANQQMQGNLELAQSTKVAQAAVRRLGLHETAAAFLGTYSAQAVTDRVLQITVSARSDSAAVREANVVAAEFLRFRAALLQTQGRLAVADIAGQIIRARTRVLSVARQVKQVSAQPASPSRKASLRRLLAHSDKAGIALGGLYYSASQYPVVTTSMTRGTLLLDPASPIPPSRRHLAVLIAFAGLVGSLAVGLGSIAVSAVVSDRVRRRDDVARALGAPVRLSVGRVPARSRLLYRHRPGTGRSAGLKLLVAHLRAAVPSSTGMSTLAVVAIGEDRTAASSLAALAVSLARAGTGVVVADLSDHGRAARILGASEVGVHKVGAEGESLVVALPDHDDGVPVGPVRSAALPHGARDGTGAALRAACESADVVLTFASLDPATGAEQLATWATDVVVIVTAGRSQPARIHAAGDMIRLAGLHLASAVLVGADKTDQSLGITRPSVDWRRPTLV